MVRKVLLGNEAIVQGALESGVNFASTYPGTPASEIGDTFAKVAKKAGIYFEYSVNEKVALEAGAGAVLCGLKAIVSMKHFGLNVASDSLMPFGAMGVSGLVVAVADDPGCYSSAQSEQDSRYYARMAHLPELEPCSPQECKEFTKLAFDISQKYSIPVLLRATTRVSHTRGIVECGVYKVKKPEGKFSKKKEIITMPPCVVDMHKKILEKIEKIKLESEKLAVIINGKNKGLGIIVSGGAFNYVLDAIDKLGLNLPILKIGMTHPLPEKKIKEFLKRKEVFVVEELDALLESEIKALAKDANSKVKIYGKSSNLLPLSGELNIGIVMQALCKILGKKHPLFSTQAKVIPRTAVLCQGCPHRTTFWAVKQALGEDVVFGGDIGCYLLGVYAPQNTVDFLVSMGAAQGIVHGIKKVSKQKAVAFIGDSTLFHAGLPGIINMAYNKSNPLIVVLDNRITAMTGHQPNPGMGITGMGEKTKEIEIENLLKSCGIKHVRTVNTYNIKETIGAIKEAAKENEKGVPAAIVAKGQCRLLTMRNAMNEGKEKLIQRFQIDQSKCIKCGTCLLKFGCPAIKREDGKYFIDQNLCWGCGGCAQVCPVKAIRGVKEK